MKFTTVLIVILVYLYLTGQLTGVVNNLLGIVNGGQLNKKMPIKINPKLQPTLND